MLKQCNPTFAGVVRWSQRRVHVIARKQKIKLEKHAADLKSPDLKRFWEKNKQAYNGLKLNWFCFVFKNITFLNLFAINSSLFIYSYFNFCLIKKIKIQTHGPDFIIDVGNLIACRRRSTGYCSPPSTLSHGNSFSFGIWFSRSFFKSTTDFLRKNYTRLKQDWVLLNEAQYYRNHVYIIFVVKTAYWKSFLLSNYTNVTFCLFVLFGW